MTWDGMNKRRFPRIRYKCLIKLRRAASSQILSTYTENVGIGGICVILGEKIDLFEKVDIELMPESGLESVICGGKVMWVVGKCQPGIKKAADYDIGIEFVHIKDKDLAMIRKIVDTNLERTLKR